MQLFWIFFNKRPISVWRNAGYRHFYWQATVTIAEN